MTSLCSWLRSSIELRLNTNDCLQHVVRLLYGEDVPLSPPEEAAILLEFAKNGKICVYIVVKFDFTDLCYLGQETDGSKLSSHARYCYEKRIKVSSTELLPL
jgi:hypothetical protein